MTEDPFELKNLAADPAYLQTLERMRVALADWQGEVEDWSEQPEAQMVASFQPNGEVQQTRTPTVSFLNGQLLLANATEGASMGYRINGGEWRLYSGPVYVPANVEIEAKAIRYGWDESESLTKTAP